MLKWPDERIVDEAVRSWACTCSRDPEVLRIGYFGSYAAGNWGVGSDVDLVVVVNQATLPFHRRSLGWDLGMIPVGVDLFVYTRAEWEQMLSAPRSRFGEMLRQSTVWVYDRDAA